MAEPTSKLPEEDRANIRSDLGKREALNNSSTRGQSGGAISGTGGQRSSYDTPGNSSSTNPSSSSTNNDGGLYNQTGDTPARLKGQEESPESFETEDRVGNGYTPGNSSSTRRGRLRFNMTRRKAIIGIGGTSTIGLIFGFFTIASGPAQIVQLSEILQREFQSTNSTSSNRLNKLLGDAGAKDIGETRVGVLGRQYLRKTLQSLSDIGIEFKTNSAGSIIETDLNTDKLSGQYSELNNMSDSERQSWIAQKYGLSPEEVTFLGRGSYAIDAQDFGLKATSLLKNNSLSLLADGSVDRALESRLLSKYFNQPSLFHPVERAEAAVTNKVATAADRRAAEDKAVSEQISDPIETQTAGLRDSLKSKLGGSFSENAAKIVDPVSALCVVRDSADDAVAFNHEAIVVPAALEAVRLVALGEEVKDGRDVTVQQVGNTVSSFTDSTGSIWQGKALRSISGESATGPDLPGSYGQAFSNTTTADNIRKAISIKVPLTNIDASGAACSQLGLIILAGANILSFIANIPDGDTAAFASYAAQTAVGTASSIGLIYFFQHEFVNLVKDKAVVPPVLSGPLGGNLAAYGARAAGNLAAIANGGIALTGSAASTITYQQNQQDQQQFRSESFFARTFNIYDYRSLAGKLAESFSPSLTRNFASLTDSFTSSPTSLFSSLFSPLMPHTQAASNYDWGFPQYGIPPDLLNDPTVANPYDNANKVADILNSNSGQQYIDKAMNCFGVSISNTGGVWDVVPHNDVNPDDGSYTNAGCDQYKGDQNWARVIMFVFDTMTMKADACYQGDDQSCSDLGANQGSGSTAPTDPGTTSTAGATIDMAHLYDDSTGIACAPNTKDIGVYDGYTNGNKVSIRLCAISNLSSSGEEANGGFGVTGGDGKCVLNSRVSGAVYAMVQAAKQDGVTLATNSCFRTMAHQEQLWVSDGEDPVRVARPGYSNHQMGLAMDFSELGDTPAPGSGPAWDWLTKNASNFGYKNYPAEAWHWSPTGN